MMDMKVTTDGREDEVKRNIRAKFAEGLRDCEGIILPIAQALAPVRTGRYRRSMGYAVNEESLEGALYAGIYKPGDPNYSPQAHIIEWGGYRHRPLAPMRRAAEQARAGMGQAIAKRCKEPV